MKHASAADLKVGDTIAGSGLPTPNALAHAFATLAHLSIDEVHSLAPWWIAQCKANSEKTAKDSLLREGFEAWYPTYKRFSPMPLRMIPPKKRNSRRPMVITRNLALYPGYVLLRRFKGDFPIFRLFELNGCGGLVVSINAAGDAAPVLMPDHSVELMRLREDTGLDDVYQGVSQHGVMTGIVKQDPRFMLQHNSRGRVVGRLDDSHESSLFIELQDRVVQVISSSHHLAQTLGR
jgi:hypothetical protein